MITQTQRVATLGGKRTLVVDFEVPDDAPHVVREGLARRRIVNGGGTCPCGAKVVVPNRAQRRAGALLTHVVVEHEDDCPACDEVLAPLLYAWLRGEPRE